MMKYSTLATFVLLASSCLLAGEMDEAPVSEPETMPAAELQTIPEQEPESGSPDRMESGFIDGPALGDPAESEEDLPLILDDMAALSETSFPNEPLALVPQETTVEEPMPVEVTDEMIEEEIGEEEIVEPVTLWPAGPGYMGFYDFGMAPAYASQIGVLDSPLGYVPPTNRDTALKNLGPIRWGASITTGVAYTDNVFGTKDNRQGDAVFTITPTILLEAGERGRIRLLYSPTYSQYTRNSSESRLDHTLLLSAEYPFHTFDIGMNLAYTRRSGLFATTEGFAELDTYAGEIYTRIRLTNKTSAFISYNFVLQNADPGDTQYDNSIFASLNYQLTKRLSVGAFVQPGLTILPDGNQTYFTTGLLANYQATNRIRAYGQAGVQFRDLGDGSAWSDGLVSPVVMGGVLWNPVDALSINAQGFRTVTNNPFSGGEATTATGGSLAVSLLMWNRLTLSGYGSLAYVEELNGSGATNQEYFYSSLGVSLTYALTKNLSTSVYYNYAVRSPVSNAQGFDRNIFGVAVTWTF